MKKEKLTLRLYKSSLWLNAVVAIVISWMLYHFGLMTKIVENSVTLAVTGVAVAAFLFTAQSILVSVSSENEYIKIVRQDGYYFPFIHRFCRRAEIAFLLGWLPMLYMGNGIFNIAVMALFVYALLHTVWAMWLISEILIISEKHTKH